MAPTEITPTQPLHAYAGRQQAVLDRLDSETVATDEGKKHARGVTNTLLRVVCIDISGQAKSARFPGNLSIGVGVLTVSVTTCAENARHGRPTKSCRILAIRKKS